MISYPAGEEFPEVAQIEAETALGIAAEGRKAENARPLKGIDGGVFQILLRHRGDAFRMVYAVQIGTEL